MNRGQLPEKPNYVVVPNWALIASIIGIVVPIVVTVVTGAWYMATLESRVSQIERRVDGTSNVNERLTRLETRFETIANQNTEIINLLRSQSTRSPYNVPE